MTSRATDGVTGVATTRPRGQPREASYRRPADASAESSPGSGLERDHLHENETGVERPLVKPTATLIPNTAESSPGSRSRDDGLDPYALYVAFEDAKDFIRRLADGGHEGARAWMDSHGVRHGRIAKQWRRRLTGRHE